MSKNPNFSLRMTESLEARLDRIRKVLSERSVGLPVDRSKVIRLLVERGAELVEKELGIQYVR